MAVRGCLALLFILLSGIAHADDVVTSPPSTAELKTTKLSSVDQTTLSVPSSTSVYSSATTHTTSGSTTTKSNTETTSTAKSTTETKVTTSAPTTTESTTVTKITTSAPTTTKSTTETKVTTSAPTTTHQNTTNSTTEMTVTTFAPTTSHHNTTNFTTEVPTTTHTNPTTVLTTPVPNPTVGNYSVKSDNASICLLANMGIQFSFKISGNASLQTVDLDPSPDVTTVSGTCGSGGSDSSLSLTSKNITVHFVFTNVSQKFRLHALTLSVVLGNGKTFNESNTNLSLWEASVGSSYLCKKEQSYNISDKLALNTFELQVQPFDVQKNMFSTAHECSMDDTSLLIPIIVGAALAGLIFIVVIAYVIGRRRTYVGYQTL